VVKNLVELWREWVVMRHKIEWADEIREHRDFYLFSKRLKATFIGRIKRVIAHYKERSRSHT